MRKTIKLCVLCVLCVVFIHSDDIDKIQSAWTGHRSFAEWLVKTMHPEQIVDLGVDFGYSTFVFANAVAKQEHGTVTGIDWFEGDAHTGRRDTYEEVLKLRKDFGLINRLKIVKGDFRKISQSWDCKIDILHIDGFHTYEAVKGDFESWKKFLKPNSIVLFHDICVPGFGVVSFFRELNEGYKLYFTHSAGLGIYTKDTCLYNLIKASFPNVLDYKEIPL